MKLTTYISILRGINVSGQRMIKMDALKQMYSELGFKNIQTYIQSGNVVFQFKKSEAGKLEKMISKKLNETSGFEVPVIAKELQEIKDVLENNPFINEKHENTDHLYVTFLSEEPSKESIEKINSGQYSNDKFIIKGKTIYLFCSTGYGKTKLSNTFFENKLKLNATTRNWKTINKLADIAEKINLKHEE